MYVCMYVLVYLYVCTYVCIEREGGGEKERARETNILS